MAPSRRSQVSPKTVWIVGLNALLLGALAMLLHRASPVVGWILIALLLALAIDPLVEWLSLRGLRRGASLLVVFGALMGLFGVFVVSFVPMLVDQAQLLVERAPGYLAELGRHEWVRWADERYDVLARAQEALAQAGPHLVAPTLLGFLREALSGVVAFFTILTLTVFMLLFGDDVVRGLLRWIAPHERPRAQRLLQAMHLKVGGFVAGSLFMAGVGGVVTAITAAALGVPYFLPLGLAMAFLSVVPFVGSAIGVTLLTTTTLATEGLRDAVIALVILLVYGQLKAKLLSPLVQRRTIQMNPLIITLVMLVGTALLGLLGTLISLPIAGAIQVVMNEALAWRENGWRQRERRHPTRRPRPPEGQLSLHLERPSPPERAH